MADSSTTEAQIKQAALDLGFTSVGICAAAAPTGWPQFQAWLDRGYAGQMRYLEDRRAAYSSPTHVLAGARSLVMLTMNYRTVEPAAAEPGQGRISRYAWGVDYHDVIHERLSALADGVRGLVPGAQVRGVVDTAPLLEREFAALAGLGWIGKHTLLLSREAGSWFFLAALLTDLDLTPDAGPATDHCGSCRACLDACPTQAFVAPHVLDARRCVSYLTIELRAPIPRELRSGVGEWLFGCDVCQDVCPWNRRAPTTAEPAFAPVEHANPVDLRELFALSDEEFRRRFRHTPLWRARRRGILRNAAIVLGNQRHKPATADLARGLHDADALVRGACAWALGEVGTPAARHALQTRVAVETDPAVAEELQFALRDGTADRGAGVV